MNTDQDIQKYLDSFSTDRLMKSSALFIKFNEVKDFIEQFSDQSPNLESLKKLNNLRLLSSNTLSKTSDQTHLDHWNKAQTELYKLIGTKTSLDMEDLKLLNTVLTGSESVVRDFEIETGSGVYLSHNLVKETLESYFSRLSHYSETPLRQAFETYLNIVTIHPFENGNGRTARLAADFYLFKNNILPACFKSPIQSHVALVKNKVKRTKEDSYLKFLKAVENSYKLVFMN